MQRQMDSAGLVVTSLSVERVQDNQYATHVNHEQK